MTSSPDLSRSFSEVAPHGGTPIHEVYDPYSATAGSRTEETSPATTSTASTQSSTPGLLEDVDLAALDPDARREETQRRADALFDGLAARRAERSRGCSPFFGGITAGQDEQPAA